MTRDIGEKLGPKLIRMIRDTIIATKKGLGPHDQRIRRDALQEVIDRAGREAANLYRPIIEAALEAHGDDIHPLLLQHAEKMKSGEHQWESLLTNAAFMSVGLFSSAINNLLAKPIYEINRADPHLQADPTTMAQAAAAGLASFNDVVDAAGNLGYNQQAASLYYQLAFRIPDFTTLVQLYQRGLVGPDNLDRWLHRQGVPSELRPALIELSKTLVSPADAALAVLRGNMSQAEGESIAHKWGYSANDFAVMIGNTGEPPGVIDQLTMFRRGIIDQQTLEHGIRESRLRNEWIPALLKYRYSPMTTADAITALVQTHISESEARQIADQNGLEPSAFDVLVQTAGEPLSKEELTKLLRLGYITETELKQGIRESRIKDKYVDMATHLGEQIPPEGLIHQLYVNGALDQAQAVKYLHQFGYTGDIVKAILSSASKVKTSKPRQLTEGMLSELYLEQAISKTDFKTHLKELGYSDAESDLIIKVDDWRFARASRDAAVSHVRSVYVGHKISKQAASAQLDGLQIPADMRDRLIKTWDLERASQVRQLTPAQIVAAWKIDLMDTATALGYLVALGYNGNDAGILLEIANKGPLSPAQQAGGS